MVSDDLARARRTGAAAWVWLAVGGTVSLVLGLVCVAAPGDSLRVLSVVLSLWLVAAGLGRVALAAAVRTWPLTRRRVQGALGAALALTGVAGLAGVVDPLTVVTVLVALGFLVAAAADLVMAATGPRGAGRAATGGLGLLHLVIGLTFLLLPAVGLAVLTVLVGLALVLLGLVQLAAAGVVRALVRQADRLSARLSAADSTGRGRLDPPGEDPRVVRGEVL